MTKWIECVPNFSEGRRKEVVDEIVSAILEVPGVRLLDMEMDPDHNRSVVTFVSPTERAVEAAFRGIKKAQELIDLNKHEGEHPRIGATDVGPFVPLPGTSMEDCIKLAEKLGKRVWEELRIPVYLYGEAARIPERQDLAYIRKGEFEGLREAIKEDPSRIPDFGERELHPTAGATAIGARKFLIAYNVNLNTEDIKIAKKIAKRVRAKGGGLAFVKALGFELKERKMTQVSMNLVDYEKTPIFAAYELVKMWAQRFGVSVVGSEIVGLVPEKALYDVADFYLRLEGFQPDQTIEARLREAPPYETYLLALSSKSPTPGGGSASAFSLAQGYALLSMVGELTLGKKKYEEVHEKIRPHYIDSLNRLKKAISLIEKDAEAFNKVMEAFKMPKETEEEKQERKEAIEKATEEAIEVPFEVMEEAFEGLKSALFIAQYGNPNAVSDVGCAVSQFEAAFSGAKLNVLINISSLSDESRREYWEKKIDELEGEFSPRTREVMSKVHERLGID